MDSEVNLGKRLLLLYRADSIVDLTNALLILDHRWRRGGAVGVHFEEDGGMAVKGGGLWRGHDNVERAGGYVLGRTRERAGAFVCGWAESVTADGEAAERRVARGGWKWRRAREIGRSS